MYLEEIDLCKRMRDLGERILEINIVINHLGGQSHGEYDLEMEKSEIGTGCGQNFILIKNIIIIFIVFLKLCQIY